MVRKGLIVRLTDRCDQTDIYIYIYIYIYSSVPN